MRGIRITALALAGVMLVGVVGCRRKAPPPAPTASAQSTTADAAAALAARLSQSRNTTVGIVEAVRTNDTLVAVRPVSGEKFANRDNVMFIDSQETPVAMGRVIAVVRGYAHIRYELTPEAGVRAPRENDVAVRFR